MPAPQSSMLKQLAKTNFRNKGIVLPTEWKKFTDQYGADRQTQGGPPSPTWLFRCATTEEHHVNTCKTMSALFEDIIDATCDGICQAWSQFHSSAKLVGVLINGPIGMSFPGTLMPPLINPGSVFAMTNVGGKKPKFIQYAQAITGGFGTSFMAWQLGFTFSAIPFPGGAVCSTTMVPSPNVPIPLMAGMSPGESMMSGAMLKANMLAMYGPPEQHTMDLFDAMGQAINTVFTTWKASMFTNILGAGGVAAPPPLPPTPVVAALGNGGSLT